MTSNDHRSSHQRLAIIQVIILFWVVAIVGKLVRLQIKDYDRLHARAEQQQQASVDLAPTRGVIFDRNGSELARSAEVKSLYASPSEIKEPDDTADKLAGILGLERETIYRRLTSAQVLAAVKRKLSEEEVARVKSLNLPGLRFVNEMKRYYVAGATGAHVLGFVDVDEQGLGGIELTYDKLIRGRAGRLLLNVDALKNSYNHAVEASVPGANIFLTIDMMIQHYAEKALADAIRSSRARGGTVAVMRPATGEILALASFPTFDPNKVSTSSEAQRLNRAVEAAFEPGSIFKIVPYAAALEEGLIRPDTKIDCQGGEIRLPGRVVHDRPYGVLTATQALAKSSNVAAIKIGMRLGNERLARYIEAFGFGRRTGVELPAESRGLLRDVRRWEPGSIGSIPMGHEVGVTAVQAVAAFACIANGGEWVQPHLVSRVVASSGDVLDEHRGETRRVVRENTANTLKTMLENVVVQGTGKRAQINGYRAAGKTGTAQKVDETTGRYSNTRYVASFAGFAPADNPEIACIVSLDEPKGAYHGGDVAAPVFARVVADALHILGVPPEEDIQPSLIANDVRVFDTPRAYSKTELPRAAEGDDSRPALYVATDVGKAADKDANRTEAASKPYGGVIVPDLTGRGIREAVALCTNSGLKIAASGSGLVASQNPSPGTLVALETICHVKLAKQIEKKAVEKRPPEKRVEAAKLTSGVRR